MSIATISNHILFPQPANYTNPPEWSRQWQTQVSGGVTGAESRRSMRATPLVSLAWTVTPWSLPEQTKLDEQIRAAKKSGQASAPFWGRASVLQNDCDASAVVLQSGFWPWAVNDYLFFLDAADPTQPIYNVRQISAVDGVNLTLSENVSQPFASGSLVWPMLFGKFETEEMNAAHSRRGEARLKITEMASPENQNLGNPSGADGIGEFAIGTTFQVQ